MSKGTCLWRKKKKTSSYFSRSEKSWKNSYERPSRMVTTRSQSDLCKISVKIWSLSWLGQFTKAAMYPHREDVAYAGPKDEEWSTMLLLVLWFSGTKIYQIGNRRIYKLVHLVEFYSCKIGQLIKAKSDIGKLWRYQSICPAEGLNYCPKLLEVLIFSPLKRL